MSCIHRQVAGSVWMLATAIGTLALVTATSSQAVDLNLGVDGLSTTLNTDLRYTVGIRTTQRDQAIGNGTLFDEGDHRFDRGDLVTNRVDATPQLNVRFSPESDWLSNFGFRISGNAFYDFVYDDGDRVASRDGTAPVQLPSGLLGSDQAAIPFPIAPNPRVPYSELSSYTGNVYNDKTKRRNIEEAEIQDAFIFFSAFAGESPINIKVGQYALFWGEALFNPFFGVSYGMGPIDINKALTIPAIRAQDLFIPVEQASGTIGITETLTVGFQYFLDWRDVRAPEGGTYLSTADPFLNAPDRLFLGNLPGTGPFFSPRAPTVKGNNHDKFGIQLKWDATNNATLGFYYREFDETLPWLHVAAATPDTQPNVFGNLQSLLDALEPVLGLVNPADLPALPGSFRLVYPKSTKLYGVSFNTKLLGQSIAGEVAYSEDRALLSELLNRETTGQKARGNLWSGVLNILNLSNNVELLGVPLFDQGIFIAELNWSYLDKVTEREDVYKETGSQSCKNDAALFGAPGVSGSTIDWCASDYHVGIAFVGVPTWYQVWPGVDLNAVVFYQNVLKNNSPANLAASEGFGNGTVGVGASFRQLYIVSLNYNFFFSDFRKGTNVDGEETITSFNGLGTVADRDYLSLTLTVSF